MNEELIEKKRADGMRLLIESNLEELTSLCEIIATEVIRVKPGENCYWFIYRILQGMIKAEDALRVCSLLDDQDVKFEGSEWDGPNYKIKPHILDYYIKESLDHYFRNGLKQPAVPTVPGCDGCQDPETKICPPAMLEHHRSHTIGDISEFSSGTENRRVERQQSWHVLQFPEMLMPLQKPATNDNEGSPEETEVIGELQQDLLVTDVEPNSPDNEDHEALSSPCAPPTSPRV
ncbi:uncharacterized protein LOC135934091 [Cloeon dipterum]|uniref:uncharacterized protein LOC135934091 n=1 Tax=Cloeon dipterum TaxID=197152 RepID=UPI00321FE01D